MALKVHRKHSIQRPLDRLGDVLRLPIVLPSSDAFFVVLIRQLSGLLLNLSEQVFDPVLDWVHMLLWGAEADPSRVGVVIGQVGHRRLRELARVEVARDAGNLHGKATGVVDVVDLILAEEPLSKLRVRFNDIRLGVLMLLHLLGGDLGLIVAA